MMAQNAGTPLFEDYPVTEVFTGKPAAPIFTRTEERQYRTVIREGVRTGYGVGMGTHLIGRPEPTFAGHFIVIRWACGSDCRMMALVDAKTGTIYQPPLGGRGNDYFAVPLMPLDDKASEDFMLTSSLMIVRHACRDFKDRKTCGTYYFNWQDNRFNLVKFGVVDPLRKLIP